jgi:hypothetical protein
MSSLSGKDEQIKEEGGGTLQQRNDKDDVLLKEKDKRLQQTQKEYTRNIAGFKADEKQFAEQYQTAMTSLWQLINIFFIFSGVFLTSFASASNLDCQQSWAPITLLWMVGVAFWLSIILQTWRLLKAFKERDKCNKRAEYCKTKLSNMERLPDNQEAKDFSLLTDKIMGICEGAFQLKMLKSFLLVAVVLTVIMSAIVVTLTVASVQILC